MAYGVEVLHGAVVGRVPPRSGEDEVLQLFPDEAETREVRDLVV